MARMTLLVVVFTSLARNAAATTTSSSLNSALTKAHARASAHMKRLESEVEAKANTLRQTMTVDQALLSLTQSLNATPPLVKALKGALHPHHNMRRQFLGLQTDSKTDPYAGIADAKTTLNEMLTDVVHKIDAAHHTCSIDFTNNCQLMEFVRMEMEGLNAQMASANGQLLAAGNGQLHSEQELEGLDEKWQQKDASCKRTTAALKKSISTALADISAIDVVVDMTDCKGTSFLQKQSVTLLKCSDCRGNTNVKFHNSDLQQKLAQIKTRSLQDRVARALESLIQSEETEQKQGPCDFPVDSDATETPPGECAGSISTNAKCDDLLDKFLHIQVEIQETHDRFVDELGHHETDCAREERINKALVEEHNTLLRKHQTDAAFATGLLQESRENSKLKKSEEEALENDIGNLRQSCTDNLNTLEAEKCQLAKIRSELYLKFGASRDEATFVDCELEEWESTGCSEECGGGVETLTRSVRITPLGGGIKCPPTQAVSACNIHPCPVDCKEEMWDQWGSCSANCDGGIKLRTRSIDTKPSNNGRACGPTTDTVSCNMEACEPDCVLADWSAWSQCSKMCDGGHLHRSRVVTAEAKGAGTCPDPRDDERFQESECNTNPCASLWNEVLSEEPPAKCTAKIDVVFLLDGSGSLGTEGFALSKVFAKKFADALESDNAQAQIAVILFSGPTTWKDYYDCAMNATEKGEAFRTSTCKLTLAQELTNNTATAKTKIDALEYPGGTTFTSGAFNLAKDVLEFARADAEKVVVTLTDGVPIDTRNTRKAAKMLKKTGARVVVVPIEGKGLTEDGTELLEKIASRNKQDNTLIVEDAAKLPEVHTVNELIEEVCGLQTVFPSV